MLTAYTLAIFLSAALLFTVEPMVAKRLLPLLGGSPSVWNACMLFFQAALLAGYAWAHFVTRRLGRRAQVALHGVLLALAFASLPIGKGLDVPPPAGAAPVGWLLGALTISIGLPFFVLSATGPLLQRWLSATDHPDARDPYFLYAASNLGSMGGLLAYPLVLEPFLGLATPGAWLSQRSLWSTSYALFAALAATCGVLFLRARPRREDERPGGEVSAPPRGDVTSSQRLRWTLLAFVPSSVLLGTTQYLSTDIAAVPLLWVIPLALYLLTFTLAFSHRARIPLRWSSTALAVLAVASAASFWGFSRPLVWVRIPIHLLALCAVGLVCHGRLAAARPAADRLTEFYLWVALGGALGGVFNTLVAPLLFDSLAEYPIALVLACLFRPAWEDGAAPASTSTASTARGRLMDLLAPAALALLVAGLGLGLARVDIDPPWAADLVRIAVPCVIGLGLMGWPLRFTLALAVLFAAGHRAAGGDAVLHRERTFFGVHSVGGYLGPPVEVADAGGHSQIVQLPFHALYHGATRHGAQAVHPGLGSMPTTYFHPSGPIGQVFGAYGEGLTRVAFIGMGAGTLAAYGRPGQRFTYYEIDPAVVRIATDPAFFTYLRDSRAESSFVTGDGRLSLALSPDGEYDMLVVDAFSSDAIPVHLLTREAVELYFRKLQPHGLLSIHVTNTYLDLSSVVDAIATDLGFAGCLRRDREVTPEQRYEGKDRSTWVVLAREGSLLEALCADPRWEPLPRHPGLPADARSLWTDDYSNVVGVLRLWHRR